MPHGPQLDRPAAPAGGEAAPDRRPDQVDVAVIGGGLAGVAAAAVAAGEGCRVALFEHRSHLGGRGETIDRDGFRLNVGPHALYREGAAARLAVALGVLPTAHPPVLDAPMGRIGDRVETFPLRAMGLATTGLLGARGKAQLATVLAAVAAGKRRPVDTESVRDWLDRLTDREDVRTVLGSLIRLATYANAEGLLSAGAAFDQLVLSARAGVLYVDGGWATLIDALRAVAARAGAEVRTGFEVTAVRPEHGRWLVDGTDGPLAQAAAVIVAAGGAETAARLIGHQPSSWARLGPPVTASVLDLGFEGLPTHRFLHGVDRPLYLSTHTPPAALAPAGCSLVTTARYHGPDEQPDPTAVRAELREHARLAGIAVDDAPLQRYLHRVTVTHGMPLAANGGAPGRPAVAVDGSPGLFVAGDWVGAEGLLADASAASALVAARSAVAHGREAVAPSGALR